MSEMRIQLSEDRTAFEPAEELSGEAAWNFDATPRAVELRLFWFTRGKGTEDAGVVDTVRFDGPMRGETRPFKFRLPAAPYSFSGKLISLIWALELVAQPSKEVKRLELVVAPGGREVRLESLPDSVAKQRFVLWRRR